MPLVIKLKKYMILYQTYPLVNDFLLETRVREFLSVTKNRFLYIYIHIT